MRNLNLGVIGTIHLYVSYGCVIVKLVGFLIELTVAIFRHVRPEELIKKNSTST